MMKWTLRAGGWAALCAAAFVLPYVVTSASGRLLAITALIYALLAGSWNLTLGFAGVFNFAHVGFFGVGGYGMAVATLSFGWDPWAGLLLGTVCGGVAGAVAYLPVIRMRGIYIALITFVFVQLCYYLVLATPGLTGGSNGLPGVPGLALGAFRLSAYSGLGYLWLTGAAVVALIIGLQLVIRSSFGRGLIALRDNEHFAVSRGIKRVRQHFLAFVFSGVIAGSAGALYVSYFRVADTTLFSFGFVTLGLSMIFLGGTGQVWGPMLGAVIVTFVDRQLTDLGPWQPILIGVGTLLVLIFMPRGIAGLLDFATERARHLSKNSHPLPIPTTEVKQHAI